MDVVEKAQHDPHEAWFLMGKTHCGQLVLASKAVGMVKRDCCGLLTSLGMVGSMAGSVKRPRTDAISPMDLPSNWS